MIRRGATTLGLSLNRTGALERTAASNVLVAGIGILNGYLLALFLGPAARGQLASVVQPIAFISNVALLGIAEEAIRRSPDSDFRSAARGTLLLSGLLGSGVALYIGYRSGVALLACTIVALTPLANAWNQLLVAELRRKGNYKLWNKLKVFVSTTPPVIFLLGVATIGPSVALALTSIAVASLLVLYWSVPALIRLRATSQKTPRFLSRVDLRSSLPHLLVSLQTGLILRGDVLLLSLSGRNLTTGIYIVAATVGAPLQALTAAIATQSYSERARNIRLPVRRVFLGALVASIGLILGAEFALVPLLGPEYRESIAPAQILVLAALPNMLRQRIIAEMRASNGKDAAVLVESFTTAATLMPLAIVLDTIGPLGASLISLIGYSAGAVAAVALVKFRPLYRQGNSNEH